MRKKIRKQNKERDRKRNRKQRFNKNRFLFKKRQNKY